MMKKKVVIMIGTALAMSIFLLIGYAMGDATVEINRLEVEINRLESELNCYKNKPPEIMFPIEDSDLSDSDKAMMEVIKKIAEIESANITIDTPEAHLHIEWER